MAQNEGRPQALPRTPVAFRRTEDAMTTLERRDQELDSGHVALLGHTILGAVSVVAGALETLRESGESLSPIGRDLLEREVDRNLETIVATSRSLIRGEAR
jgi:hypothetical protein